MSLIAVCVAADGALVGVWERCAVDLGSEWAEGLLESGLAGERKRQQRAAMVAALVPMMHFARWQRGRF